MILVLVNVTRLTAWSPEVRTATLGATMNSLLASLQKFPATLNEEHDNSAWERGGGWGGGCCVNCKVLTNVNCS